MTAGTAGRPARLFLAGSELETAGAAEILPTNEELEVVPRRCDRVQGFLMPEPEGFRVVDPEDRVPALEPSSFRQTPRVHL